MRPDPCACGRCLAIQDWRGGFGERQRRRARPVYRQLSERVESGRDLYAPHRTARLSDRGRQLDAARAARERARLGRPAHYHENSVPTRAASAAHMTRVRTAHTTAKATRSRSIFLLSAASGSGRVGSGPHASSGSRGWRRCCACCSWSCWSPGCSASPLGIRRARRSRAPGRPRAGSGTQRARRAASARARSSASGCEPPALPPIVDHLQDVRGRYPATLHIEPSARRRAPGREPAKRSDSSGDGSRRIPSRCLGRGRRRRRRPPCAELGEPQRGRRDPAVLRRAEVRYARRQ